MNESEIFLTSKKSFSIHQYHIKVNITKLWLGSGKGDDNTTGKKQAHEMRGVLLTILCYCLLQVHYKELSDKIGGDVLAMFLTVLMEDWLGK